jgi:poly-D-alanine transfer protein DltD
MATPNTYSNADTIQSLFNPLGNQDAIKMMASMNERMTAIFVEAGTRSVEIMSHTAKESYSNFGAATHVRNDPAEYAEAYGEFAQKQIELMTRAAQDIGEVTQKAGTETKDLASEAGEEMSDKVTANAKEATDNLTFAVKDTAEKSTARAKDAADKSGSAAKKAG